LEIAKGVFYLIEAFSNLATECSDVELVLVGDGEAFTAVQDRIRKLGLQGKVQVLGFCDGDIESLVSEFDLFIFPSLHEGFPYSLLEAMRLSRAIIATRVGGIPEAIEHELDGLLVDAASVPQLGEAMRRLYRDASLRETL